jgi:hypothetical protein
MRFVVGDTVRHRALGEVGRIVRYVAVGDEQAYVVAIRDKASGRQVEVLWRLSEIQEHYPEINDANQP